MGLKMKTEAEILAEGHRKLYSEEYGKLFDETLRMMYKIDGVRKTMNDFPALVVGKNEMPTDKQMDELDALFAEVSHSYAGLPGEERQRTAS